MKSFKQLIRSIFSGILMLGCTAVFADTVAATVSTGNQPFSIAVNSATNKIYVANTASNNVTVIDKLK